MNLDLADRAYLVAGSSRGIGKAIAMGLLVEGASVCFTGRDRFALEEISRSLGSSENAAFYAGDLSKAEHVTAAYKLTQLSFGKVDGLVANLGTGSGTPGWKQSEGDWDRSFALNFRASTLLAEAAISSMPAAGGCIVFISSITGVEATAAPLPYSAAKAALQNYAKNLSRELAAKNIRVNCVAPGNIRFAGGSWERRLADNREAVMEMIERDVPMRRFGTPEEIANIVLFLLSNRSSFVTGACIVADGGQTRSI